MTLTSMPSPGVSVRRKNRRGEWEYGQVMPYGWIDARTQEWRHGNQFPVRWNLPRVVSMETMTSVDRCDDTTSAR